ncbi:hypothetical protein A33Q_2923 [Indibacter alkaliphilus LW1]|uniref:Uncharacterized protein n=1 Tax=Indibacter alkaliphilus (strain CCUG 57479 / KCTC 22604 / LW1) TaxID=1189612 RepID=S2DU34_INDAL|nr:hypothetical protein A33Q_2923 [Indibacter alkaliphilus LW1]
MLQGLFFGVVEPSRMKTWERSGKVVPLNIFCFPAATFDKNHG